MRSQQQRRLPLSPSAASHIVSTAVYLTAFLAPSPEWFASTGIVALCPASFPRRESSLRGIVAPADDIIECPFVTPLHRPRSQRVLFAWFLLLIYLTRLGLFVTPASDGNAFIPFQEGIGITEDRHTPVN